MAADSPIGKQPIRSDDFAKEVKSATGQTKAIPKEVLHTRARERLLEHFLSVVLRPGRMPPLTSQSGNQAP